MKGNGTARSSQGDSKSEPVRIAIVGSGYIGLVVAACFAEMGHTVISVDGDATRIGELRQRTVPFYEHFLPELFQRHYPSRLSFTTSLRDAVAESEAIFMAVGTPVLDNGEADLSYVEHAAEEIAESINGYKVLAEISTAAVSTSDSITAVLLRNGIRRDWFDVVSNPEFLREGTGVTDFLHPDRIIVGTESEKGIRAPGKDLSAAYFRPVLQVTFQCKRRKVSILPRTIAQNECKERRATETCVECLPRHEDQFYQFSCEYLRCRKCRCF